MALAALSLLWLTFQALISLTGDAEAAATQLLAEPPVAGTCPPGVEPVVHWDAGDIHNATPHACIQFTLLSVVAKLHIHVKSERQPERSPRPSRRVRGEPIRLPILVAELEPEPVAAVLASFLCSGKVKMDKEYDASLAGCSWDGDPSGWTDFVRCVRLLYEKTPRKKRRQLGPSIVSRLRARAWTITQDVNHAKLTRRDGCVYLLEFLRDRLGRSPIPDIGIRLEELMIKLRRTAGTPMSSWASQVRQTYKRVQVALHRARKEQGTLQPSTSSAVEPLPVKGPSAPSSPSSSSKKGRSSPTRRSSDATQEEPQAEVPGEGENIPDHPSMAPEEDDEFDPGVDAKSSWRQRKDKKKDDDDDESDDSAQMLADLEVWDRYEEGLQEVLPPEVLGWLLLRRANLPTSARLSIQAAAGNSLLFTDIERAMRAMEDELMVHDDSRRQPQHQKRRSFWVEGEWSLLLTPEEDLQDVISSSEILHVGSRLPQDVYFHQDPEPPVGSMDAGFWHQDDDGAFSYWELAEDGEFYTQDSMGLFWAWNDWDDFGTSSSLGGPSEISKETEDAFSLSDPKSRTFTQARQAVRAQKLSRGFYPFNPSLKGKSRGKGKGKGKFKGKGFSSRPPPAPVLAATGEIYAQPGDPSFTGCFVCGAKDHSWRSCPKRSGSSKGGSKGKGARNFFSEGVFMIQSEEDRAAAEDEVPVYPSVMLTGNPKGGLTPDVENSGISRTLWDFRWDFSSSCRSQEPVTPVQLDSTDISSALVVTSHEIGGAFASGNGDPHQRGHAVIDSGATETVGSLPAIEDLMRFRFEVSGSPDSFTISDTPPRRFRFGNGSVGFSLSHVLIPQDLGDSRVDLGVYSLDVEKVPILIGIRTLKSLRTVLDCSQAVAVFAALDATVGVRLRRSASGHLLLDLSKNWLQDSFSIMVSGLLPQLWRLQISAVPSQILFGFSVLYLRDMATTNERDLSKRTEETTEKAISQAKAALRVPTTPKSKAKSKESKPKEKAPELDWDRIEEGNPKDARLHGSPCHGSHQIKTRSNQHAMWQWCERCGIRLCYVPRAGKTGLHRAAGPLAADVQSVTYEVSQTEELAYNPRLKNQAIGLQAAENSALRQLEKIRAQKEKVIPKSAPPMAKASSPPSTTRTSGPMPNGPAPSLPTAAAEIVDVDQEVSAPADPEALPTNPGNKRHHANPVEQEEYAQSFYECDQLLHQLATVGAAWNRSKRLPLDEKRAGGYLTFGLFSHGNMQGLTRKTHAFPCVCRYLNAFGKFHLKEHSAHWTSFSISMNQAVNVHLDGHNSPDSSNYTCSFGQFDGGQLWVELTEGFAIRYKAPCDGNRNVTGSEYQVFFSNDRMTEIWYITRARKSGTRSIAFLMPMVEMQTMFRWLSWAVLAIVGCANYFANKEAQDTLRIFSRVLTSEQKVDFGGPNNNFLNFGHRLDGSNFQKVPPGGPGVRMAVRKPTGAHHFKGMAFAVTSHKEVLEGVTKSELEGLLDTVQKLHRRFGHPTNSLLVKNLRARGASPKLLAVAAEFKCDVCLENQIRASAPSASLEREDRLWCALQIDGFYMRFGQEVFHFLLMVDEASGFCQVEEVMRHSEKESRNVTTAQVVRTIETRWCQLFGFPETIKLDPEGAFRGLDLAEYCSSRGIELGFVPAEYHQGISEAERTIGTIRRKIETFLRAEQYAPSRAAAQMVAAHNTLARTSGFSPAQWAFGRDVSVTGHSRERDGEVCARSAMADPSHAMHEALELRTKAEKAFLEYRARDLASRALNSKTRSTKQFLPGDIIFYQRFQVPQDTLANTTVDRPRLNIAGFYGPGRVLATETRVDVEDGIRKAGAIVWAVCNGRLKKFHHSQVRHASETERLVAEGASGVAFPWTFASLADLLEKGSYDDESLPRFRTRGRSRTPARSRSLPPTARRRIDMPEPPVPQDSHDQDRVDDHPEEEELIQVPADSGAKRNKPEPMADEEMELIPAPDSAERASASSINMARFLNDPQYFPVDFVNLEGDGEATAFQVDWAKEEVEASSTPVFAVTLDAPATEAEWKSLVKNPKRFLAKSVQKGVEVSYAKLNPQQRRAMDEAMKVEVDNWMKTMAVKATRQYVPQRELLKMRWVLTFKSASQEANESTSGPAEAAKSPSATGERIKAKARIVILGYSDPNLLEATTVSPAMTRLSRQLLLNMAAVKKWDIVCGDVKSAFLQAKSLQADRCIFAAPVPELSKALNLREGQAVQLLRSVYGLVSAPREWYEDVHKTLLSLGAERLSTDNCVWRIRDSSSGQIVGLVSSHVDDFLMCGDSSSKVWKDFLFAFGKSYEWSPWEHGHFKHCGVSIMQHPDFSISLDHSAFCQELKQMSPIKDERKLTADEVSQVKAILGSVQWRVYQTAPQHAAKLSYLQSLIASQDASIVEQVNKLVREVYASRSLAVQVQALGTDDPEELCMVGWSDASLANRPDLSSTGGFVIGLMNRRALEAGSGRVNPVSWRSGKLHRIARSSLSAEAQSLADTEQELFFARLEWREMLGDRLDLRQPELYSSKVAAYLIVDAKAMFDSLSKGVFVSSQKDKYTGLELLALNQRLEAQKTILLWCDSDHMLADGLTKETFVWSSRENYRALYSFDLRENVTADHLSIESWRKTRLLLNGAFHTVAMPKRQQDGDPEPKKRKKKTQGHDDDCEGERGFLVTGMTCQNALRGLKDLRLWLEVEAEVAGTTDEAAERPQGVAESLDAELAELRSDPAQRRFLTVGMVCKEVAFLRCQHKADLPSGLAKKCLGPSAARRFVSHFADRVLPVDGSTRPKLESFKSLAEGMLSSHAGRPWRLLYEAFRGGWNTISKEDAMEACKQHLGPDSQSVSEPEVTIVCTVQPRFVGLAAVELDIDCLRVDDE
ncbi:putative transposon protein [Symbiodinium microadriaticum]|uniref:Putative transposon protein n=1 Tax=Symbiodinium microadriaticum TaxID=2951 RepID=A0A1Q9CRU0_SYMMI|nr:putative transposon protein [Symbiodinium microadriaticum]